jgi:competence protein ComFC
MFRKVLDLFFPVKCIACLKAGDYLCIYCEKKLHLRIIGTSDEIYYCFNYDNKIVRQLIYLWKFRYVSELVEILGRFLSTIIPNDYDFIVPVPTSRVNERGYNQTLLLAKTLVEETRILDCLIKKNNSPPQSKSNRKMRISNLHGNIVLKSGASAELVGRTILLIDDVIATGATVNECRRILKEAGVKKIRVAVLARSC